MRTEGKLTNAEGEFIASGPCDINAERAEVTMWPAWEMHMLERERGELALDLADGRRYRISDRHLTFKLQGPTEQRISVYRLRILEQVPDHLAAGYEDAADATDASDATPPEQAAPRLRVVTGSAEEQR